jgi:hypothetical protein
MHLEQHPSVMIRTQISLSPEEYTAARCEADRLGISLAELLRRSLLAVLPQTGNSPWMRFAGMVESGDSDSSKHINKILYGEDRQASVDGVAENDSGQDGRAN